MSHKVKIHAVGNYLNPLQKYFKGKNIYISNLFDGCSPFVIEGEPDDNIIKKYAFDIHDPLIFSKGSVLNIWKDFGKRISNNPDEVNQTIYLDKAGKPNDIKADSQYVLVMNTSIFYNLYEYHGNLYSDIWPVNRFIKEIKSDKDTVKYSAPFYKSVNWKFYYDKFIEAIQREYDHEHIILVKTNSASWYIDYDNNIKNFDKRASEYRNFIDEVDRYFIEKTNCLCINSHFNFIPYGYNSCLIPYAVMSEEAYKVIADQIADIVKGNLKPFKTHICKYHNPLAINISNKFNSNIITNNKNSLNMIENKWLTITQLNANGDNSFFASLIRLKSFLNSYNSITLSDYVIDIIQQLEDGNSIDVDYALIDLYFKYMKTNINDFIALYMLCINLNKQSEFEKIIESILNNKECTILKQAYNFKYDNIEYLKTYPYIMPELQSKLNEITENKVYVYIGVGNYIAIDINKHYFSKELKEPKNIADYTEIIKNGYVCSISEAPSLISNIEFYVTKSKKGDAGIPITILFKDFVEFEESLNYINYKELLENESFVLRTTDSDWKPASFSGKIALQCIDNMDDDEQLFYKKGIAVNFDNMSELAAIKSELSVDKGDELKNISSACFFALENNEIFIKKYSFYNKIKNYISGFKIAEKYIMNDVGHYYFIKCVHLGDITRAMPFISYFKAYRKTVKKENIKKITVITSSNLSGYIKMFADVDDVITLPKEQIQLLNIYAKSELNDGNLFYDTNNLFISWAEENICTSYSLPEEYVKDNPEIYRFPSVICATSVNKAEQIIKQYNTTADKIIIMFPYAQSSSNIDLKCWSQAVKEFTDYGYTVFTNVGLGEQPLENTVPLDEGVDVILALGQLGSLIVGVQSGMMDTFLWLDIQFKFILVAFLNSEYSFRFAVNFNNRIPFYHHEPFSLDTRIQHYMGGAFIAAYTDEEKDNLSFNVIEEAKYFIKGDLFKSDTLFSKVDLPIIKSQNLNEYVKEIINLRDIVIFISVCDSANKYWNEFESRHLLGLKEDLSKVWRLSYIAVVDIDKNICKEKLSNNWDGVGITYCFEDTPGTENFLENEEVKSKYGSLPLKNNCYIFSCAMDKRHYTKSSIIINGNEYSANRRGLNIVVYSKKQLRVIDSINVDSFGDPKLLIKREGSELTTEH